MNDGRGPRRAIVTGGAQGIGAAIVRRLAADGTLIAVVDRQLDAARDVVAPIGGVDLAEPADVARSCQRAADLLGGCDVLVNDAGVFAKAPIVETTAELLAMAAKKGTAGEAAYAASKAAVVALTRIAALEFGPDDVTVNAVCPGYVLTW